ncbi:hypothetical protein EV127DRAFT_340386 [Xylaria flabelliformis]|nr:hypothetical protein EV127DRAFT_340386 [Xylaria flabelliformis]
MASDPVLVPLQLQAFVLNPEVCNKGDEGDKGSRIIPIIQPNYTFLRLDNFMIQSDVLNHADLHNAAPAETNMRMTDMGARPSKPRRNRYGVYLHWILPQMYRSGVVASDSVPKERHDAERLRRGLAPRETEDPEDDDVRNTDTPEYLRPPTRWIVIRKLDMNSVEENLRKYFNEYDAWVLDSDYKWNLDDIPLDYDLQTDVSPFVVGQKGGGTDITQQAEVFIGRKTRLADYEPPDPSKCTDISLLSSGNPFFADFQLHNSNVFSILDNFEYFEPGNSDDDGKPKERTFLDKATASYYLVGWHSSNSTDPLWDDTGEVKHFDRLQNLFMELKDTGITETTDFLKSTDPVRMCLHGAMYDVHWNLKEKPESPADNFSEILQYEVMPATAVGTSPMDTLITYITARKGHEKDEDIKRLEEGILAIESLLHARDDGVEGQREAKDMIYNWNFSRSQGGKHYFVAGEDTRGKPTEPDDDTVQELNKLNQYQQLLDACERSLVQYRWDMFSIWWKYVTNVANRQDEEKNRQYMELTKDLSSRLEKLQSRTKELEGEIEEEIKTHQVKGGLLEDLKSSTLPFYFRARDPTMLVGGVDSGWPVDFNDNVITRLAVQCTTTGAGDIPTNLADLSTLVTNTFPQEKSLKEIRTLLSEFWTLEPGHTPDDAKPPEKKAFPQFHHEKGSKTIDGEAHRDHWGNRQPWFPLYAEWEAEYTHIPFEYWELGETTARLSSVPAIRYGVPPQNGEPLWETMDKGEKRKPSQDTRILSGRVLILPQPSFSLAAKVRQLFLDTPPDLLDETGLTKGDRDWILDNISRLSFLSCPLTGFTEGLLTLSSGSHIKPENKFITNGMMNLSAIEAALFPDAGLSKTNIELIAGNSASTPYSTQGDWIDAPFCPFKPATHGQFRFTKFNIIDKFGQALVAINPKPRPGPRQHPPLYPSISDFYEPQVVTVDGEDRANTVLPNPGSKCEFIQLPPQIDQNSRLNADFVIRQAAAPAEDQGTQEEGDKDRAEMAEESSQSYWRPVNDWENPIWGWLVINYADQGIQIFLADGTFYREVRMGGPHSTVTEPEWLPFARDPNLPVDKNNIQLDELVRKLGDRDYLHGFWVMISVAIQNMPPSSSAYAQFLGSIVGKPLALVNMGVSLELEGPALTNQSTNVADGNKNPEIYLLADDGPIGSNSYELQVKLGDKFREYDGLVGYFDTIAQPTKEDYGKELVLDQVNTYFFNEYQGGPPVEKSLRPIDAKSYPKLKPYWIPPFPHKAQGSGGYKPPYISPDEYVNKGQEKMTVFGTILDPFTPVHAFSSFLPAKSLQLQPWTWQDAMQNITAFFHAGPLTVTNDVGGYDDQHPLTTKTMKYTPVRNVALPSLGAGDWSWLQPFVSPDAASELPVFNAFGIEKKGNVMSPGFEKGPYTALEGFLQLRRPIMVRDPEKDDENGSRKTGVY